ncbi:Transcriptional regulator, MerR family [Thermobacillus xylanilyticus]|uniref:Transcriptional regulator, MerR family n=1 Tax=Thermobacillus xylanilyticus TaxID=76633 RepID=A0ABM8V1R3_THEXY|nr:MerR family transcriptional regulator [Thermobacillus xylanilyticus]CAG5081518.1 Transcriptional regulator, MerR family [Thermobacillus xylanilyticus]
MFKISEFSKISRVSVKTLRYYDQLGLLKPARTDEATGYRYYTAEQLIRLHRILAYLEGRRSSLPCSRRCSDSGACSPATPTFRPFCFRSRGYRSVRCR